MQLNAEDFPTAKRVTYLNSASISLMPRPAIEAMIDVERKIASGGTIDFDEIAETEATEGARAEDASLLRANEDEVAILSSASECLSSLAWSLDLPPGSNIVSTDADFPSVVYPWLRLAREKRLEVRLARNQDGVVKTNELEKLVDDKTAAISISHVEYGTGQRFDLRWLSEVAHAHGALLIVDASQSIGLIPTDVEREGVDVLVAAGYKGLLGPFGAAVLYVKECLFENLRPSMVGWRSAPDPYALIATDLTFPRGAKKFEFGTMDYAAATGLTESIRYLKGLGRENITSHVTSLSNKFLEMMIEREGGNITILTPMEAGSYASIVSFRFKGHDQSTIASRFVKSGIIVSQRFNAVRFSFHAYNTEEDVEKTTSSLQQVLRR
jgi:selenocysteine lyase/cysteine desulfurase